MPFHVKFVPLSPGGGNPCTPQAKAQEAAPNFPLFQDLSNSSNAFEDLVRQCPSSWLDPPTPTNNMSTLAAQNPTNFLEAMVADIESSVSPDDQFDSNDFLTRLLFEELVMKLDPPNPSPDADTSAEPVPPLSWEVDSYDSSSDVENWDFSSDSHTVDADALSAFENLISSADQFMPSPKQDWETLLLNKYLSSDTTLTDSPNSMDESNDHDQ